MEEYGGRWREKEGDGGREREGERGREKHNIQIGTHFTHTHQTHARARIHAPATATFARPSFAIAGRGTFT